jgi:hypothetical protein
MGFVNKITTGIMGPSVIDSFTGQGAADAATKAAQIQAGSAREGINYQKEKDIQARSDLLPFTNIGLQNTNRYQSLLTPQGQTDYLMNNPLFKFAMDKLDRTSNNTFLGRGKLGDATGQLVQNAFIAGQPLLQQQTGNVFDAIRLGQNSAAGQATNSLDSAAKVNDLTTAIGNAQASGQIGVANARAQGTQNLIQAGTMAAMFASDRRLKRNISRAPDCGKYKTYFYQYVWSDAWYRGVMSDEVRAITPSAVITDASGYDRVCYGEL